VRYRAFLKGQLPHLALPTAEEERADPEGADRAYESVTAWLRTQTRDTKTFSILFRENISYGFRRNLWGLKPLGVTIALLAASASTAFMLYRYSSGHSAPTGTPGATMQQLEKHMTMKLKTRALKPAPKASAIPRSPSTRPRSRSFTASMRRLCRRANKVNQLPGIDR
jgi:hypothetical protein